MRTITIGLFVAALAITAEGPAQKTKPEVHLSDMDRAILYKLVADVANAQLSVERATAQLKDYKKNLEAKCGSILTEEPNKLADCSQPPKASGQ